MRFAFLALSSVWLFACQSTLDRFECETSSQCTDQGNLGICEPNGLCSFRDSSCASDQRYGRSSGTLSGACVADVDQDAAPLQDASIDAQVDAASVAPLPDADLECVDITVHVSDAFGGDDKVRLLLDAVLLGECAAGGDGNICEFCAPMGQTVAVVPIDQIDLSLLFGCQMICTVNCTFTATVPCAIQAMFN